MALDRPDLIEDSTGGGKIEKIPLVGKAVENIRDSVKGKVFDAIKTVGTALVLGA